MHKNRPQKIHSHFQSKKALYNPYLSFKFLHQSLAIHASNSVISIALPANMMNCSTPLGVQS